MIASSRRYQPAPFGGADDGMALARAGDGTLVMERGLGPELVVACRVGGRNREGCASGHAVCAQFRFGSIFAVKCCGRAEKAADFAATLYRDAANR